MDNVVDALRSLDSPAWYNLGPAQQLVESALHSLEEAEAVKRIWARDGSLWTESPHVAAAIKDRLGWLDLPRSMPLDTLRLMALAAEIQAAGFERIILLGMGGSSLAPEVTYQTLGAAPDYPQLVVLDSTDPSQIRAATQGASLSHTLFLVASKSGTTAETMSLFAHFRAALAEEVGNERWPRNFVAITDPGTPLEELARREGFRAVYANPADVGGRYSALSLFGLVPGALVGVDLDKLLGRAKDMAWACRATSSGKDNPGLLLGAIMGALASQPSPPRDKLTFISSTELAPFGAWVEQLIAESTGKQGRGILPVIGEPLDQVAHYGSDRLFAYLRLNDADNENTDSFAARLAALGHPLVVLRLGDLYDLGAEFFRWEFATAVAGQILGVNPFDQPDVDSAKSQARQALAHYEETQSLPQEPAVLEEGELSVFGPSYDVSNVTDFMRTFLGQAEPGNYVALMAYVERNRPYAQILQKMRDMLQQRLILATTAGFGPRFLHSTGQLHKGGPNTGLFLQITQDESDDLPIPGHSYSFGILKLAQALGDLEALRAAGRRVVRIHIGSNVEKGLLTLAGAIEKSVQP